MTRFDSKNRKIMRYQRKKYGKVYCIGFCIQAILLTLCKKLYYL